MENEIRYSDAELAEFKEQIEKKQAVAIKERDYLQSLIDRKGDDTKGVEDEKHGTLETDQLSQMLQRQVTYIGHLHAALGRVEDKSYGICRVTGKLIDKPRLKAVPHATLSLEAKLGIPNAGSTIDVEEMGPEIIPTKETQPADATSEDFPERKCRVCGCTQNDCRQCIAKTGEPCHWVEDDLCSACVEVPNEEHLIKTTLVAAEFSSANFFQQLSKAAPGVFLNINIMEKNGKYTVSILPGVGSKTATNPVVVTGGPEELDNNFFNLICLPVQEKSAKLISASTTKDDKKESSAASTNKPKPAAPNKKASAKPKQQQKSPVKKSAPIKKKAASPAVKKKAAKPAVKKAVPKKPVEKKQTVKAKPVKEVKLPAKKEDNKPKELSLF
jgi:RNA polymerase-binding transcription factor DksA